MDLNNKIWEGLEGGYRLAYNPVLTLRKLESTTQSEQQDSILLELWDELHHQGDVGVASYLSVP